MALFIDCMIWVGGWETNQLYVAYSNLAYCAVHTVTIHTPLYVYACYSHFNTTCSRKSAKPSQPQIPTPDYDWPTDGHIFVDFAHYFCYGTLSII